MNEKAYWIALSSVPGIGPVRFAALLEIFQSPGDVWHASVQQLLAARLDKRAVTQLLETRRSIKPAELWRRLEVAGVSALTWLDTTYPSNLRHVDGAPPVLYCRGTLDELDRWAVAIVGTRRASVYGKEVAHRLATRLAAGGVTIVSGLALGIDTVAHQAALDAGGRTIAVLGSGVDQLYPARNRGLAAEIIERGAVVSEYALGTRPEARFFPPRNRIISGLSQSVVIVEAGTRSGALITSHFAADQGRDVFAVPGSIFSPGSAGCNKLIQSGAIPLLSVDDVFEQLSLAHIQEQQQAVRTVTTDPVEKRLLELLSPEPQHIDDLVRQAEISAGRAGSALALLELKGLVRQVSTLCYVRN